MISSQISANNCGMDPLNNQILLPFATKEECLRTIDVCDKYNIPRRSKNINREECLQDVNCGYCTNESGGGKCISGNASKPNDIEKYYYCKPNAKNNQNKYEYGNHSAYLLQH